MMRIASCAGYALKRFTPPDEFKLGIANDVEGRLLNEGYIGAALSARNRNNAGRGNHQDSVQQGPTALARRRRACRIVGCVF